MQFRYLFPERVEALVLVSSGGLGRTVSPLLRSATLPGAELVLPVIASAWVRERVESVGRAVRGPSRTPRPVVLCEGAPATSRTWSSRTGSRACWRNSSTAEARRAPGWAGLGMPSGV